MIEGDQSGTGFDTSKKDKGLEERFMPGVPKFGSTVVTC